VALVAITYMVQYCQHSYDGHYSVASGESCLKSNSQLLCQTHNVQMQPLLAYFGSCFGRSDHFVRSHAFLVLSSNECLQIRAVVEQRGSAILNSNFNLGRRFTTNTNLWLTFRIVFIVNSAIVCCPFRIVFIVNIVCC
jgi:hypothetical protein